MHHRVDAIEFRCACACGLRSPVKNYFLDHVGNQDHRWQEDLKPEVPIGHKEGVPRMPQTLAHARTSTISRLPSLRSRSLAQAYPGAERTG